MASDFTLDDWNWSFSLRDVSSSPDITGRPVSLNLSLKEDARLQRQVSFSGRADFRSRPQERFNAEVAGIGFPVKLGNQLSMIGINGFSGETDFSVNVNGQVDSRISAGGEIIINQARILEPRGTIAEIAGMAVEEANSVNLGLQYTNNRFRITTNIADLIEQILRRTVETYIRLALDEIERLVRQKINEYIDGRFDSREEIDALLALARGDRTIIEQTLSSLDAKKNEFEQRIRSVEQAARQAVEDAAQQVEQAARQAVDEVERQAQQAVDEAERQAQLARAEAERQAQLAREEAERRAREEAEQAARQAIQGNLPSLPGLPGRR
jgi:hypothetical protein